MLRLQACNVIRCHAIAKDDESSPALTAIWSWQDVTIAAVPYTFKSCTQKFWAKTHTLGTLVHEHRVLNIQNKLCVYA